MKESIETSNIELETELETLFKRVETARDLYSFIKKKYIHRIKRYNDNKMKIFYKQGSGQFF